MIFPTPLKLIGNVLTVFFGYLKIHGILNICCTTKIGIWPSGNIIYMADLYVFHKVTRETTQFSSKSEKYSTYFHIIHFCIVTATTLYIRIQINNKVNKTSESPGQSVRNKWFW